MKRSPQRVVRTAVLCEEQAEALANLLETDVPECRLPPLWHWTYLLDRARHRDLAADGHPACGIPAPPGPGLRRMFAAGRVRTYGELRIGESATRTTHVAATRETQGSTGPLTFVTVRHEYAQDGATVIVDDHEIVYRRPHSNSSPTPQLAAEHYGRPARRPHLTLTVDETLLFRFSALTYNAHRIHYDRSWARREGYGDLVVHGPLQALMMGELIRRAGAGLTGRTFDYRLLRPMVGPQTFTVVAASSGLETGVEVHDENGTVTAVGSVGPIEP